MLRQTVMAQRYWYLKNSTWESFNGGNSFLKISVAGYSYAMSCDGAPMYAASRDGPMWKSHGFAYI